MTPGSRRGASKTALSTEAATAEHPSPLLRTSLSVGDRPWHWSRIEVSGALCSEVWESLKQQGSLQSLREHCVPPAASPSLPLWGADVLPRYSSKEILTLHRRAQTNLCHFYHCVGLIGAFILLACVSTERNKNIFWVLWKLQFASTAPRLPTPCALPPL